MSVAVREATPDDRLGVRRVLDAAMLEVRDDLPERIAEGDVLVAEDDEEGQRDAPILGALVLIPRERGADAGPAMHIDAVAVRRARRGRGIGSELVHTAAERYPRLTAEFDPSVRPFYESLGFDVSPAEGEGDRLRGNYETEG